MSGFRHPQLSSSNPGSLTNGSTDNDEEDMETGEVNSRHQDILLSGNQAKMSGFRHPQLSSSNPGSLTNGSTDNDEEDMETGEEPGHQNDVQQSDITQKALEMGLGRHLVERTLQKMRRTGSEYSIIEDFIQDYFNQNPESNAAKTQDETLLELQRRKECKVCIDRDTCIVFIPCGHLVTCQECAEALDKCPICYRDITRRQMSYWT